MRSVTVLSLFVSASVSTLCLTGCTTTEQQMAAAGGGFILSGGNPIGAVAGYAGATAYQAQQANTAQEADIRACQADVDRVGTWAAKHERKANVGHPVAKSNDWRNVIPDGDGGTSIGREE